MVGLAYMPNGTVEQIFTGDVVLDGVRHSRQIADLWSADELAALGLYRITQAALPGYDPLTQKIVARDVQVGDASAEAGWDVVTLTDDEKWNIAVAKIDESNKGLLRVIEDLVAFAANGTAIPQAVLDKVNARRGHRGQPPL